MQAVQPPTFSNDANNGLAHRNDYSSPSPLQQSFVDNTIAAQSSTIVLGKQHRKVSVANWWSWFYLFDWLQVILLLVLGGVIFDMYPAPATPFKRFIPTGDTSIMYPVVHDIFPYWGVAILVVLLPLCVFSITQFYLRSGHDFHHSCLSYALAIAWAYFVTNVIKAFTGRLRPDYMGKVAAGDTKEIEAAMRSFPSGHASVSFASMTFISLYLSGKLMVFRSHVPSSWLATLAWCPLWTALAISISRTIDYSHHFSDTVAGTVLGMGAAFFFYFLFYPSLTSKGCRYPKTKKLTVLHDAAASTTPVPSLA